MSMDTDPAGPVPSRARFLLCDPDPVAFLDALFARLAQPGDLLLADPGLPGDALRQLVTEEKVNHVLSGPAMSDGALSRRYSFQGENCSPCGSARLFIPTGGTTAAPRFARHSWATLRAAAQGFGQAFPGAANSICLLPLWHVGGLMQVVRARVTVGQIRLVDWSRLVSGNERPDPDGYFLSLVPTQLQRLLTDRSTVSWLRGFRAVFLGGGPARFAELDRARAEGIPLAPAYGMTETAAQVSVLKPEVFLEGGQGVGPALPHTVISVVDDAGHALPAGETGLIRIEADSLFLGYGQHGEREPGPFLSGDLGFLGQDGSLTVVGRSDDVIISGGEKIVPGEVEMAIIRSGLAEEVVVLGCPDPRWGEVVCAALVGGSFVGGERARMALRSVLANYKIPRHWVRLDGLPRNSMGKLDRERLAEMMESS